jgi:hypothetical protein
MPCPTNKTKRKAMTGVRKLTTTSCDIHRPSWEVSVDGQRKVSSAMACSACMCCISSRREIVSETHKIL